MVQPSVVARLNIAPLFSPTLHEIRSSGRWPRPGYLVDDIDAETMNMIIGAGEPGVLLCEALSKTPRNEIEVCRVLSDFINRRPAPRLACKTCEYPRDPTCDER
jgi:hypothetical protein